jgi:hypothetical protein
MGFFWEDSVNHACVFIATMPASHRSTSLNRDSNRQHFIVELLHATRRELPLKEGLQNSRTDIEYLGQSCGIVALISCFPRPTESGNHPDGKG